jgi:aldehyde:ferredoxin oxidoreductase
MPLYGFYNKLLRIDLTKKEFCIEGIGDEVLARYLGGKGLGSYLLLNELEPNTDPLSPENKIVIAIGPATDTVMMGVSRFGLFTKSPLTDIFTESYSGGQIAPMIKRTGYDAVILQGASDTPVVLEISDQGVVFHDAGFLWGKNTYQTEDGVLKLVNKEDAQAMVIGPAGENLVRYACVEHNYWRSAKRAGVGAVLGSKKVKGLVFHGNSRCELANHELLKSYVRDFAVRGKTNGGAIAYRKYGTPMFVALMNSVHGFPTRYWHQSSIKGWESISAEYMVKEMKVEPRACHRCFFACRKLTKVLKGVHKGLTIEGPDYETINAFGGGCCITSMEDIVYLNDVCDRLGIDPITAGNMVGFAIEASKRGAMASKVEYGDVTAIADLLYKIAYREGDGDLLAEGIVRASKAIGLEEIAVHVKGLEPPGYDPRILKGMGLAYAVSDRGACHLRSTFYKPELSGVIDRNQIDGKAKLVVEYEDRLTLFDTMVICRSLRDMVLWEDLSILIKAFTGLELDNNGLRRLAGNIADIIRTFNIRCGITRKDDTLPKRFFNEPVGPDNETINESDLELMLDQYYAERGWDNQGVPPLLNK